ncbi:MAG TPA: gamma-glutamyltransferase [Burkholderiales bacterium]|nr:gamma-glutamyltransferase [Burkholderiales bacterium]
MSRPPAEIETGRPVTMAPRGMVVSPHSLASEAGVEILKAGGSAVDAAIATSAALAVIYPHMTSVGGDAFWLIYDARRDAVRHLDGAGRAAASAGLEWFRARGMSEIPYRGALPATLTVPGAVASWSEAHAAFGRVPFARNLGRAIELARDGYPVTERLAKCIGATHDQGAFDEGARTLFLRGGRAPRAGSRLVNPDLGRTLEAIADRGRDGFYGGEVARELARYARAAGGFFDAADLAAQTATWGEPLVGTYRDVTLYETPAPTQGFTVLEMLNLLETEEVGAWDFLGPDHVHYLVQAKQIAYHDRDRLLADPAHARVPIDRLISKAYAAERRHLIDPRRALPWDKVPSYGTLRGDTVYVGVVDADGNAASLIQSVYGFFGAGVVAGRTGVVLQNRSAYFALDPGHPNRIEAGKKPAHTLIASLAVRGGKLWQALGCMGADGQPQIHLQAYVGLIDFGLNAQQAVEAPRWLSGRFGLGDARDLLNIEGRFAPATIAELERRGHLVHRWPDHDELAGHAHCITIDPASGLRLGGSDPRSDGAAIGY